MASLRKNVASQNVTFQLINATTGAGVTAGGAGNVSKDGGAQAACTGTFTHLGTGQWLYVPVQAETNATAAGFQFTGTGAIPVNLHFFTDNYDTTQPVITSGTGTDQLSVAAGIAQANVEQWDSVAIAEPSTDGIPDVNIKNIVNVAASLDANSVLNVSAKYMAGTALTGRDIGASVLLSAGTGAGQLDFTTGVVKSNSVQWLGGAIPAVNVTGVPLMDLKYTLGTISPATAGSVRCDSVTGAAGSVTGAVGSVTGNVGGSVASVTAGVTVTTNNDKTGYSLASPSGVRENVALTNFPFLMRDSTNHNPLTGATVTVTRSIDGGAFAAGTLANVTEISNGWYRFDFGAADLNGTNIAVRATATGADDLAFMIHTDP